MLKSDIQLLNDGIQVLKPMLTQLKPKNMIDLYFEVLPFEQAFSSILSLLIGVMTIPVSSTPTERTFSKMKLIKTVTHIDIESADEAVVVDDIEMVLVLPFSQKSSFNKVKFFVKITFG
ncbi:unnamed protein product [Rotaria socialis]|uniref:HAT C-terminal dimerisation domain-containing protein n=1 Tax=Rotaria socialis TaxID=392032 RepID=A0A821HAL6_9BILA|nr:unnamed protein product [Rotaria socialis]